jgi:pimeloyl-ACP methyl ester carboxylesterase
MVHGRDANRTVGFEEGHTGVGHFPEFAAALQKAGFSVLMIDLRGHGESGPSQYTFGILERGDIQAAVDWLAEKGYQPGKIAIFGLSLGSASSVGAAHDDPRVGALVLDSLFADLNPIIEAQFVNESGLPKLFVVSTLMMAQLRYGVNLRTARPIDEIVQFAPRPILLIHCTDDELIPISHMEQLKTAVPGAQTYVEKGCIHPNAYITNPAAYTEKVIGFLTEAIP